MSSPTDSGRDASARRGSRPLIIAAAVAAACLLAFYELAEDFAYSAAIHNFDRLLAGAIQSLRAPLLTALMRAVTTAGGAGLVAAATIALVVRLLAANRRADAAFLGGVVMACGAVSWTLKGVYSRVRPPQALALIELPTDFSFPSGHTLGSLALAGCVIYLAMHSRLTGTQRAAVIAGVCVYPVLVGISRVYLGVHWPSDVLASWLLGAAVLALGVGLREWARGPYKKAGRA